MKKLILYFLLFLALFSPSTVYAENIKSFNVLINAQKNGNLEILETIVYNFEDFNKHGIYRYIPRYSKVGNFYRVIDINNVIVQRNGKIENFTFTKNNEQFYLKIGNKDKTITGIQEYKIFYKVKNAIGSNFSTHDEVYWNITGNDWNIPIEKVKAQIQTDFGVKQLELICYEGYLGEATKCRVKENIAYSTKVLSSGEGLTIVAIYSVSTFPKSILSNSSPKSFVEKIMETIFNNYQYIFIFLNFVLGGYLVYWYQKHKNKKRFGSAVVNFDIPKDENSSILRPALVGTIDTAKLEKDDIVATIFDLAIRKYLKIEEEKTARSMLPDTKKQIIVKLKEADGNLLDFEKDLFNFIFESGDRVDISTLQLTFYKAFQKMEKQVFNDLISKKYYIKNPSSQKGGLIFLAFCAFFTANFILGAILIFLSIKLNGRTALGDEIDYKIDGLKLFLKSMNRNYKWQAKNFYTVEQMIPYAMALGYIDKFMESIKVLKPDYNPTWYSGYKGSFYGAYLGFYSSFSTTVASSSSSGRSGGFSGGGGGGGGGGSW